MDYGSAEVLCTDVDPQAVRLADENAAPGLGERVRAAELDWERDDAADADVLLAADVVYQEDTSALVRFLVAFMAPPGRAALLVCS